MKTWRQLLGLEPVKPLESPISYLPPEKKEYKGFLKKTYGSLDEATLTVHPNGIAIVSWCSKNYHIPDYDEKNSIQEVDYNCDKWDSFIVIERIK